MMEGDPQFLWLARPDVNGGVLLNYHNINMMIVEAATAGSERVTLYMAGSPDPFVFDSEQAQQLIEMLINEESFIPAE